MEGVQVKPLTVGFHETQFLGKLNGENQAGFWFQLSDGARQQMGSPWGPSNPQALNRYSYVQNNPLKYTDPSGHVSYTTNDQDVLDLWMDSFMADIESSTTLGDLIAIALGVAIGTAFTGPGAIVAGGAAALTLLGINRALINDANSVKLLFSRAKVAADDNDTFVVSVVNGRVKIVVYDENGKVKFDQSHQISWGVVDEALRQSAKREGIPSK
jgi:hypothetical protein